MFRCIDKRGDGVLSPEEFQNHLCDFGMCQSDIDRLFASIDKNHDGYVDLQEFQKGFERFQMERILSEGTAEAGHSAVEQMFASINRANAQRGPNPDTWGDLSTADLSRTIRPMKSKQYSAKQMEKHTEDSVGDGFNCGVSAMQGRRPSMEDAHIMNEALGETRVFGVFDGHGGSIVSEYVAANFVRTLAGLWDGKDHGTCQQALTQCFFEVDRQMVAKQLGEHQGCTGVVLVLTPTHLLCANAGDSRCIMQGTAGTTALSEDHKPGKPGEQQRIQAAGGHVVMGRVNGNLAVSRAFGDFHFKANAELEPQAQLVSVEPDVVVREREAGDEFVVLACDGIWDVMDNACCAEAVSKGLEQHTSIGQACEVVVHACLDKGSADNMSLMVLKFVVGK